MQGMLGPLLVMLFWKDLRVLGDRSQQRKQTAEGMLGDAVSVFSLSYSLFPVHPEIRASLQCTHLPLWCSAPRALTPLKLWVTAIFLSKAVLSGALATAMGKVTFTRSMLFCSGESKHSRLSPRRSATSKKYRNLFCLQGESWNWSMGHRLLCPEFKLFLFFWS